MSHTDRHDFRHTDRHDFRQHARSAAHFTYAASGERIASNMFDARPLFLITILAVLSTVALYLLGV